MKIDLNSILTSERETEMKSGGPQTDHDLSEILQDTSGSRRRLLEATEALKASLGQLPSSKIQGSSTILVKMAHLATQVVEQIVDFDKTQQGAIKQLIQRVKLRDQENQKLRKKLAQIGAMASVNLPDLLEEGEKHISQKKKISDQKKAVMKSSGIQATQPALAAINQQIEVSSYSRSLMKKKVEKNKGSN